MNKIYLLLLSLLPYTMVGQYTDIINSNLPGNSQSAYAVGPRVLQMEGGLWYEHKEAYYDGRTYKSIEENREVGHEIFRICRCV